MARSSSVQSPRRLLTNLRRAPVALHGLSLHQTQRLELGRLTADRRMIAADQARQFDDADRMVEPDPGQQREQRPVQLHAGAGQERLVEVGPVHEAVELQQNGVDIV